jgi:glycosyltransferase involved in cell wall biosynthesis
MPCVSVVIPAYKHRAFIRQTLDSVFAQTFSDYEVIVVNDGSPDDTAAVLEPLIAAGRIRYFEQPNRGQAVARNRGVDEARGEFVALLDDDDVWPADKLQWQVQLLRDRPDVGAVAGDRIWWDGGAIPELARPETRPRLLTFESLFGGNPLASPGQVLIRKKHIESLGGFNQELWGSDDFDLWIRLSRITRFEAYDRIALLYRAHATNASGDLDRMLLNTRRVINSHAGAAARSDLPRLLQTANRWIYEYVGSRLVERLQNELGHMQIREAARSCHSLATFAEWGWSDPTLVRRFLREMFPVRRMLVNHLPTPVVGCIRAVKRLGHASAIAAEGADDPTCIGAAE